VPPLTSARLCAQGKKVLCIKAQASVLADVNTLHAFLLDQHSTGEEPDAGISSSGGKKLRRTLSGGIGSSSVFRYRRLSSLTRTHT
jgi:hypothetical protein